MNMSEMCYDAREALLSEAGFEKVFPELNPSGQAVL